MARPSRSRSQILASALLSNDAAWMMEIRRADFVNMFQSREGDGFVEGEWGRDGIV